MKVLVIAPEIDGLPKLAHASELTRLGDVPGLDVQPLVGALVTRERIQQKLRGGRWQAVVWSGHGAGGRLLLPGGAEVEPRWLTSELRRAGVALLVLAVCDSGQRRGGEGWSDVVPPAGIHLIAMAASISDVSAVDYDVALLHALVSGDTIREAHLIGLEALRDKPEDQVQPQLWASIAASAGDLAERSEALKQAITAGQSDDALALIHQCKTILGELEDRYQALDDRVLAIERKITPPWQVRLWQGVAAFVIAVAASLFFVHQARELLFNPWFVGVAFETTLLALAVLCWRMAVVTLERMK
jgi:hypothetical protein